MKNKNNRMMKTSVIISSVALAILFVCLAGCDTDSIYKEEQFKKVIYLLSGSQNVFTEAYTLTEEEPVRYFSVGIGGSTPNDQEVTVEIGYDMNIFNRYNILNFNDENDFARLLPLDENGLPRYEIGTFTVTIPANPEDQYIKVPIKVRPQGLSPDTLYFIPLAIKSATRYEVNETKFNMLYRVTIENEYAQQRVVTNYARRGTVTNLDTDALTPLTGSKIVQPLSGDEVRMFVGNYSQGSSPTLQEIESRAIIVKVNEDNTVTISPYGTIEIEMIDGEGNNRYEPALERGLQVQKVFFLNYRYRESVPGNPWQEVEEELVRVE